MKKIKFNQIDENERNLIYVTQLFTKGGMTNKENYYILKDIIYLAEKRGEDKIKEEIYQELDQLWVDNHGRPFEFELAFEEWNRKYFKEK
jgi:hypothetical protein